MQKKNFRKDINGLRALAILSVVFFHFNKNYLPGGFIGVDVFFVISGYLMTSIIFKGIDNGDFSIFKFIKSRVNRIVPALVFTIIMLLIIGYLCLEPLTYKLIGEYSVSSLIFMSNYTYGLNQGYFDIGADKNFLLHTWSLSLEWQFYILYPISLYLLTRKYHINIVKKIILLCAITSFLLAITHLKLSGISSYFMLRSRAWEMLIGGIAYIYPIKISNKNRAIMELTGFTLIITSLFIVNEITPWPGIFTIIPVLGAYLIILSDNKKTILSNFIFQRIGLLSYSIYLIHWPVYVLSNKLSLNSAVFILLPITLFLSMLLYVTIEKKRDYNLKYVIIYILVFIFSIYISRNGASNRIGASDIPNYHLSYYGGRGIKNDGEMVRYNKNKEVELILVGDSLARQYANYFNDSGVGFIGVFNDGCFSSNKYYATYDEKLKSQCLLRYVSLKNAIKEHQNAKVIIAQRWDENILLKNRITDNSDKKSIDVINEYIGNVSSMTDSDVYVIGLLPKININLFECNDKKKLPLYKMVDFECQTSEIPTNMMINNEIKMFSNKHSNTKYFDASKEICKDNTCSLIDDNREPIYSDNIHLSIFGARKIGQAILDEIQSNAIMGDVNHP
ncbi:acyltransferase [Morganella morganii]|uniref:acyltransferase family protein n=1 Tax=Morganella morganii TaxID=582 RepID=UPI001C45953E|nr:acyltransferase family protein [Morganella morganii]QXO56626.1 acyltransferase [Morganella morganii]QXO75582.1 acyltransferase [Morganella morganii]